MTDGELFNYDPEVMTIFIYLFTNAIALCQLVEKKSMEDSIKGNTLD